MWPDLRFPMTCDHLQTAYAIPIADPPPQLKTTMEHSIGDWGNDLQSKNEGEAKAEIGSP